MPHEIVVLAMQDSVAFDLGIPRQAFGGAVDAEGEHLYRVRLCSVDGGPVRTNAGFDAVVGHDISIMPEADTVIVLPGLAARRAATALDPAVSEALLAAHARGARIMSICTGAFVLGAIGLLDGKRATTFWQRSAEFREQFPLVNLEPDVLFVDDGILSSAGVAAGLDLCLHVIRTDFGVAAANGVARNLVMPPMRFGGQAQYIERSRPVDDGDRISTLLVWMSDRIEQPLGIDTLARQATMSERTLTRRFREHTGTSPAAWILDERLARARELLESTDLYIDEIAQLSGLGSGTHLRSQFQRRFAQSPTEYRKVYRPISS